MNTTNTDLATAVARHAPGITSKETAHDLIHARSEPPYRATYMHLGLPEPTGKPPLRCVKLRPGVQTGTELLLDDERAMWEYVLHLEAKVRELAGDVQPAGTADSTRESTNAHAEGGLPSLSEAATTVQLVGPQERAQDVNFGERPNHPDAESERAGRDHGAQEGQLEMSTLNGDSTGMSNDAMPVLVAPDEPFARVDDVHTDVKAGDITLRDRVVGALLQNPTNPNTLIGEQCGCSPEYARLRRKELEGAGQLQPVAVRRSDGSLYQRTANDNVPDGTEAGAE